MVFLLLFIEFGLIFLGLYFLIKIQNRRSQIYSIIVEADSENIPIQDITSALQMEFSTVTKDIKPNSTISANAININLTPLLQR